MPIKRPCNFEKKVFTKFVKNINNPKSNKDLKDVQEKVIVGLHFNVNQKAIAGIIAIIKF